MSPSISAYLLHTQSDERLLASAREGHERAFETLVARYRKPLLRYCGRLLLPDGSAEDALQQGLLQAWIALRRGAEVRDARAWLYRVVHNAAIDALRSSGYDHDQLSESLWGASAPHADLERRIAVRQALAGLAALPELQREALLRTAVEGHSHEDVAAALGLSDGAVRGLVYRARVTLRTAVTAVTPPPLVVWAANAGRRGAPLTQRLGEVAPGGAAAGATGGALFKGGAVVLTAGAVFAGAAAVHHIAPARAHDDGAIIARSAPPPTPDNDGPGRNHHSVAIATGAAHNRSRSALDPARQAHGRADRASTGSRAGPAGDIRGRGSVRHPGPGSRHEAPRSSSDGAVHEAGLIGAAPGVRGRGGGGSTAANSESGSRGDRSSGVSGDVNGAHAERRGDRSAPGGGSDQQDGRHDETGQARGDSSPDSGWSGTPSGWGDGDGGGRNSGQGESEPNGHGSGSHEGDSHESNPDGSGSKEWGSHESNPDGSCSHESGSHESDSRGPGSQGTGSHEADSHGSCAQEPSSHESGSNQSGWNHTRESYEPGGEAGAGSRVAVGAEVPLAT